MSSQKGVEFKAAVRASGRAQPIAKAWNVRGWPTIYVLDATGMIGYKGVRGKHMDQALDKLLKELEVAK